MPRIKFLGAAGEVTGSCYLLTGQNGENILVDMGIFQGDTETEKLNYSPLAANIPDLKAVFLTHAHLDHCGRLPLLVQNGFRGKIYSTAPTRDIVHLILLDSAHIAVENPNVQALFTKEDVEKVMQYFELVEYDRPVTLGEFTVTFKNAGHILGSASIIVTDTGPNPKTLVFSGDLGNSPEDLIQPTENVTSADIVLIESTYGKSAHPEEDVYGVIKHFVNSAETSGGTLLIPAFSVERTQEILHQLHHLKENGDISAGIPVYLDSPMAIEVTEIFKKYPNLYNQELSHDPHPFDFPGLIITKKSEDSKKIIQTAGPKVIVAGSGMMSGGRIMHHLRNYASNPTTGILIVGYQAVGTLGRRIESGVPEVTIYGEKLEIRAEVTKLESLSSHADQPRLIAWLKLISGVTRVFIIHGEDQQRSDLAEKIKTDLGFLDVVIPQIDETFEI